MRTAKRYRMIKAPGHPVASTSGLALLHRKVLYDKIGPGVHPCHWCGLPVEWARGANAIRNLVVDHLDHSKDNNDADNLVPACNPCNGHRRGHDDWKPWRPGDPVGQNPRYTAFCRRGHALTENNIYRRPDTKRRQCHECIRINTRRVAERHRAKVEAA